MNLNSVAADVRRLKLLSRGSKVEGRGSTVGFFIARPSTLDSRLNRSEPIHEPGRADLLVGQDAQQRVPTGFMALKRQLPGWWASPYVGCY